MPLIVDGSPVCNLPYDINHFISSHTSLQEASKKLKDTPSRDVGPKGLLYVCQGEYAVVAPSAENIDVLGADDATTCHILVLRHSGSGVTCMSHLDGLQTKRGIQKMVAKVKQLSRGSPEGRFEAHLAGGFLDDRKLSLSLTRTVLSALVSLPDEIHLLTACVTDFNDVLNDKTHFPVIYGLAFELETGAVYPATFHDKGPDVDIRCAVIYVGREEMVDVFDGSCLTIGPFTWGPCEHLAEYISRPDDFFRSKKWSTSPEQEPAHYGEHVRNALRVLHDNPCPVKTLFQGNRPRVYHKQSDGLWACSG